LVSEGLPVGVCVPVAVDEPVLDTVSVDACVSDTALTVPDTVSVEDRVVEADVVVEAVVLGVSVRVSVVEIDTVGVSGRGFVCERVSVTVFVRVRVLLWRSKLRKAFISDTFHVTFVKV
jgi:hypothetical protein